MEVREGWLGPYGRLLKYKRDISAAEWVPWEMWSLNPKLDSPAYSTRVRKGTQETSCCEKQWGCVHQGEVARDTESLLNGQHTKFHLQLLNPGCQQREGKVKQGHVRRIWGWWLWWKNWRVSIQDPSSESFPVVQRPSFLGRVVPSMWHQPGGGRCSLCRNTAHPIL